MHKQLCPRRQEFQSSKKGSQSQKMSVLLCRILLQEKPGCIPTEWGKVQHPMLLSQRGFWGKCIGGTGMAGAVGKLATGACSLILINAQHKLSLGVSLSPSGGITITQSPPRGAHNP